MPRAAKKILRLLKEVKAYMSSVKRPIDLPFLMPIEDVFVVTGRGIAVTGNIECGTIQLNETVAIVGLTEEISSVVTGIAMSEKMYDSAISGDEVDLLLKGINEEDVRCGQVLAKPGSIHPHTGFKAMVYMLTQEEGGRYAPILTGHRLQFHFRTEDVTGLITFSQDVDMIMPGTAAEVDINLLTPAAIEKGLRFAIRENDTTIGAGVVTKILK